MTQLLYFLSGVVLSVLIVPLVFLILYLRKYLQLVDGAASKFRRIMFNVFVAKLIFLLAELGVAILLFMGGALDPYVLVMVLLPMSFLAAANWYAFIKIREILKGEINELP